MGSAADFLSGVSAYTSGQQQKHGYELQAQQEQLAGEAQVTDRTRALNEAMANQNAMMGASGRGLSSISAVMAGDQKRYGQDIGLIRSGAYAQSRQSLMAGRAAQAQGSMKFAMTMAGSSDKSQSLGGASSGGAATKASAGGA